MFTARSVAHILIVVFVAGFFATHSHLFLESGIPQKGIWQHFFEGGLVGALADWFAVTALFRRPLGIPFPHSAILVRKQATIAKQFGVFVEEKFLSPEVVKAKIESISISSAAAAFLGDSEKRTALSATASEFIYSFKELALSPALIGLVSKSITDVLRYTSLKSIQDALKTALLKKENIYPLFDRFLKAANRFIEEEKETLKFRVKKSLPWFLPSFIDEKLYEILVQGIKGWISEIQADPNHPFRSKTRDKIEGFLDSDSSRAMIEQLKNELLDSKDWQHFLEHLFMMLKDATGPNSGNELINTTLLSGYIAQILSDLKTKLEQDPKFQQQFQNVAEHFLITIASSGRGIIGSLITETLQGWNTKTLVTSIEGSIGPDLQYIRINGTVLGSILGVVLFLVGSLIKF